MSDLRAAKRRLVREALSDAARRLVLERGLDEVTAEDIADAVGVSTRTFFNYFPTKDDAIVGVDPTLIAGYARSLRERPADESPADALHAVIFAEVGIDQMPFQWEQHNELVHRHPALMPRYLASLTEIETVLADVLAERAGLDTATDPRPRVLVASALAVLRATVAWWLDSDRTEPLPELLDRTYRSLVADLPATESSEMATGS